MYLGVWARNGPHARVSTCSASTSTPTTPLHVPPNCQTRGIACLDLARHLRHTRRVAQMLTDRADDLLLERIAAHPDIVVAGAAVEEAGTHVLERITKNVMAAA